MTEETKQWLETLWAKTGENGLTHLLPYHLIDVAEVTLALWQNTIGHGMRAKISEALGVSADGAGRFTAFLLGLHDLGKASVPFQRKYEPKMQQLREMGMPFGPSVEIPHGIVSGMALGYKGKGLLSKTGLTSKRAAALLAQSIGGHHGAWPSPSQLKAADDASFQQAWIDVREALFNEMRALYLPPSLREDLPTQSEAFNAFLILISGFTTVADWIGSMAEHFPMCPDPMSLAEYQQRARTQAATALRETGWLRRGQGIAQPLTFADVLPNSVIVPNRVQQTVLDCTEGMSGQSLILLEAPTGIGKTEMAFYLANTLLNSEKLEGFYIAMPTQATSNQMYERTSEFLATRYPDQVVQSRLLHTQAAWQIDVKQTPSHLYDSDSGRYGTTSTWFLPKKRGLLEPFAVGTVDQALLSVLWTKHFFVRLFGLAHKVLIFDEVHAYDTYMNELFLTLLDWLRWLGSSAIILSATLPNAARRKLVQGFGGNGLLLNETENANSRLTVIGARGQTMSVGLDAATQNRHVSVDWIRQRDCAPIPLHRALVG